MCSRRNSDEFKRNYRAIQKSYDKEMKRYKKGKRKEPPRELPRHLGKPQVWSCTLENYHQLQYVSFTGLQHTTFGECERINYLCAG